jgi:methylglutaconyl-CoA hydratase
MTMTAELSINTLIKAHIQGPVATIQLHRPDLHNAFNEVMIQELQTAFQELGHAPGVRVIILSAEGKSFCAGADLNWMKKMVDYTFEENVHDAMALAKMLKTIHDCPKPVIARVHGATFGGGVGLTAACDMAIATQSASFCLSEVKLGLLPAVISPFVMEKIGVSQARRYFLTAERFAAQKALDIGLVHEVVEDEKALDATIQKLTEAILQNGPEAVTVCKKLIDVVSEIDWENVMHQTARLIADRRISTEGQDGMKAFLEKRPAAWLSQESK